MIRTIGDVLDVAHATLLGVSMSYMTWMWSNRAQFLNKSLGRVNFASLILLSIRLLTSIRMESDSASACYPWIFCRATISLFGIPAIYLWYQNELFINLYIRNKPGYRVKMWRWWIHGFCQGLNGCNAIYYVTHMRAVAAPSGFCAILFPPAATLLNTGMAVITSLEPFFVNIMLLRKRTVVSAAAPELAHLFRTSATSCILLMLWVALTQLDSAFLPWAEWKTIYFTATSIWITFNSLLAIAYLLHTHRRAKEAANGVISLPTPSVSGFSANATLIVPTNTKASGTTSSPTASILASKPLSSGSRMDDV